MVTLRAVKHHRTGQTIEPLGGTAFGQLKPAFAVLIVGDDNTILRYDACYVISDGSCYEQSFKWIDMSTSNSEDYYGDLYDVFFFDPTASVRSPKPPLAYAVGRFKGKDGAYSYTRLNKEFGQLAILRLTAHGEVQPQNSPHGWSAKNSYTCNDPDQYGCWVFVTPAWSDGLNFETGFTQNSADLPPCCTTSTVRCLYPDDFLNCHPWPSEYAVSTELANDKYARGICQLSASKFYHCVTGN